jgi:hypothetical protein
MIVHFDADATFTAVVRSRWPHDLTSITVRQHLSVHRCATCMLIFFCSDILKLVHTKKVLCCNQLSTVSLFGLVCTIVCFVVVYLIRSDTRDYTRVCVRAQNEESKSYQNKCCVNNTQSEYRDVSTDLVHAKDK